ncbi:MAG: hypothetical protein HYW26_05885 [Candidatus Aenigmarchaeota archaeon]|nr:hypothetical protein [Candidatus Aenigmarchaeota archaeon]
MSLKNPQYSFRMVSPRRRELGRYYVDPDGEYYRRHGFWIFTFYRPVRNEDTIRMLNDAAQAEEKIWKRMPDILAGRYVPD